MQDSSDGSVSIWLSGLKRGEEDAARAVFERCFERLVSLARRRLGTASRRVADEEDVALSVLQSVCRGAAEGRFERLLDRNDLWQLLIAITQQKVVDLQRHNARQKRGGGEVRGESAFLDPANPEFAGIADFAVDESNPFLLNSLAEEHERLLGLLRDDVLRRIALLRLEGFRDIEIAVEIGISLRSVERKLSLIRDTWIKEIVG